MTDQERIKGLEADLSDCKQELATYKLKGVTGYYYELNRLTNGTVALMREMSIKSLLNPTKDEDPKKFEKVMTLIKNVKGWTDDMEDIKTRIGLSGDEEKDKIRKPFIDRLADKRD